MVRRAREASFMGGARVFPGGAVDAADSGPLAASVVRWSGDNEERPWRAAAMRELAEEVGIFIGAPTTHMAGRSGGDIYRTLADASVVLDGESLVYVGNWVTPGGSPSGSTPASTSSKYLRIRWHGPIASRCSIRSG